MSFDVTNSGESVWIDVDLPEIEDMPGSIASVASRGFRINTKKLSGSDSRRLYMTHVHGVGFRLTSEAFHTLPKVNQVTLSRYSQRPSKATGQLEDDYLYSVAIHRPQWNRIAFNSLEKVDPVEALAIGSIRRKMTKTGIFSPITPFSPAEP